MAYSFNYEQFKKRLNKKTLPSLFVLIITLICLLFVTIFLYPNKQKKYEFYMVELAAFQTYSKAVSFANIIKEKQGAGYIYFEKKYRVFACHYNKKDDAESVVQNLKIEFPQACVYSIKIANAKIPNSLNSQQKICVENIFNTTLKSIKEVTNLSIEFDKSNLTLGKLTSCLGNTYKDFNSEYSKLKTLFLTDSKYNIAKDNLQNINSSFEQLKNFKTEDEFTNNFKYLVIDIVVSFNSFANCFI